MGFYVEGGGTRESIVEYVRRNPGSSRYVLPKVVSHYYRFGSDRFLAIVDALVSEGQLVEVVRPQVGNFAASTTYYAAE
jgi:hypothetical protein